jgi:hypothetical protein
MNSEEYAIYNPRLTRREALNLAKAHCLRTEFYQDFDTVDLNTNGIDTGEFLAWLGY